MPPSPIIVEYFSDLLCIWGYAAQPRVKKLRDTFASQIKIEHRFISIFGDTKQKLQHGWKEKGSYSGFNKHVRQICDQFDHINIHPDLWVTNQPTTSANAHLIIKAIALHEKVHKINASVIHNLTANIQDAFFQDACDISQLEVLYPIVEKFGISKKDIEPYLNNGTAIAALCFDEQLRKKYLLEGSPTFVLNEGRQKLYGNIGYRTIEANIQELLRNSNINQAS
jgi:predicted DsbA family dithiol-disulfide isomerase